MRLALPQCAHQPRQLLAETGAHGAQHEGRLAAADLRRSSNTQQVGQQQWALMCAAAELSMKAGLRTPVRSG